MQTRTARATALANDDVLRLEDLGLPDVMAAESSAFPPLADAVETFRREYILRALDRCGGNRTQAARLLGVEPRTVFRYLEQKRPDRSED
jgi:DNA-binding NtrC family response regulator